MSSNKIILLVVGLFIGGCILGIFAIGAVLVMSPSEGPFTSNSRTNTASPIIVTAPVLVADYEANEIAADEKYKGRKVQVSGVVDSIAKDILDSMYVTLDSGKEFSITSVQCFFDDTEKRDLANLVKGLSLTVECRCDGKFGNVLLKECTIKSVRNL